MGDSPPAPHRSWSSLKLALDQKYGGWDQQHPGAKAAHYARMEKDFDDETKQIEWCFSKMRALLTAIGIVLTVTSVVIAVAPSRLHEISLWTQLAGTLLVMAFLLDGWGLSARGKIYRKLKDSGLTALVIMTGDSVAGEETVLISPIDANVYHLYKWMWHRSHMHNAIEKLFTASWVALVGAVALALVDVLV
jgi:hypothetical protein